MRREVEKDTFVVTPPFPSVLNNHKDVNESSPAPHIRLHSAAIGEAPLNRQLFTSPIRKVEVAEKKESIIVVDKEESEPSSTLIERANTLAKELEELQKRLARQASIKSIPPCRYPHVTTITKEPQRAIEFLSSPARPQQKSPFRGFRIETSPLKDSQSIPVQEQYRTGREKAISKVQNGPTQAKALTKAEIRALQQLTLAGLTST